MLPKKKICNQCGKEFIPFNSITPVCSYVCALKFNSKKEVDKRVKELKKGLLTHSDYLNALQVVFNTYIRLRDKGKGCISCGISLISKFDAGHFYSVGAYSGVRFNENNVHGQCVHCNQHLHGNLLEYSKRLPQRIGTKAYKELELNRHQSNKLSIPEITELIAKYKLLIKEMK